MKLKIRQEYKTATPSLVTHLHKTILSLLVKSVVKYHIFYV